MSAAVELVAASDRMLPSGVRVRASALATRVESRFRAPHSATLRSEPDAAPISGVRVVWRARVAPLPAGDMWRLHGYSWAVMVDARQFAVFASERECVEFCTSRGIHIAQ